MKKDILEKKYFEKGSLGKRSLGKGGNSFFFPLYLLKRKNSRKCKPLFLFFLNFFDIQPKMFCSEADARAGVFAGLQQRDCLSRIFRASFPAEFFLTECGHIREIGHGCPI